MNISIKNIDPLVVKKLDELSKKCKISRNEYIKRRLSNIAYIPEIDDMEYRYQNLSKTIIASFDLATREISYLKYLNEEILKELKEK